MKPRKPNQWLRRSMHVVIAGSLCGCTEEPKHFCSDEFDVIYLTAVDDGETLTLTQGATCTVPCDCNTASDCGWEVTGVPAVVGAHEGLATRCTTCGGGYEFNEDNSGTIEIVRIDENGVVGCAVDTCYKSFRFEATWCSE
jgi:hypothetical protein